MEVSKSAADRVAAIRVISIRRVVELTSLSKGSVRNLLKEGAFPRPVQLAKRRIGWREHEVLSWLEARPCGVPQQ